MTRYAYPRVLAAALLCYAALGAVLRIIPPHVGDDLGGGPFAVGLAVGAPAITGVVARPLGGRLADRITPAPVLLAGSLVMSAGIAPAVVATVATQVLSRLLVGAGEGMMMAAAVLWLMRLAGPERRGRALGHIGLANYGGLAAGPALSDALSGAAHPGRVFAAAAILPLAGAAIAATVRRGGEARGGESSRAAPARALVAATLRPGLGLLLVNVGYAALVSFGTRAAQDHGLGVAPLVVPVFALTVIAARTAGAGIPDRAGPRATLTACAPAAGAGLLIVGLAHAGALLLAGVVLLAAGQALAVPALGLLALAKVPPQHHGAAAGLFFSYFDAGVGLGGPLTGLLAHLTTPAGALAGAAPAVAAAAPIALVKASRRPT